LGYWSCLSELQADKDRFPVSAPFCGAPGIEARLIPNLFLD
jgi:hypothetical protein